MKKLIAVLGILYCFLGIVTPLSANGDKNKPSEDCNIQVAFEYEVEDLQVTFKNITAGKYDVVEWQFGDKNTSTDKHPTHNYSQEGMYTFCLTASSSESGCSEEFCGQLYVFAP